MPDTSFNVPNKPQSHMRGTLYHSWISIERFHSVLIFAVQPSQTSIFHFVI